MMKLKIDKKDCLKKDLVVPTGFRCIEDFECLEQRRTNDELNKLLKNCYVWVNTPEGIRAAGLFHFSDDFLMDGDVIVNLGRSRGVFVKKNKVTKK